MSRRELREHIFRILFRNNFHPADEMTEQISLYLSSIEVNDLGEDKKEEIRTRACGAISRFLELDEKIEIAAEGWQVQRMGKVELSIIRLALFEILFDQDIPTGVAINEAVELSKKFGGDDSPAFVNGILAKLV